MPDAIAHYKILGPLGAGGLGEVYRARDTQLGRTVAVKVLPRSIVDNPARLRPLLATAKELTALSHPNIAMLFESGQDGEQQFLVFEFVQGQSLSSLINGRPVNIRRALEFAINLTDALADAHGVEMIHGDIRPDTIMVTPKDRAKFINFGLSKFTTGGAQRLAAASPYVAPEEVAGQPADSRSDIYSLGAVLFEMVTGRQRARGLVASNINANVPPELDQIIGRMLASNVESRVQSAAAIGAELRSLAAILDTRTEAAEAAFEPPRSGRAAPRRSGVLLTLALIVVVAGLAAWIWRSGIWLSWR
jgi:serine/threonine protein kinase